jgi:hypothetical protein
MLHTLYKGIVTKNISTAVQVIYFLGEEDGNCLAEIDSRIRKFPVQQSINPFCKKIVFYQG